MFNKVVKEFQWGKHKVIIETGEIARQANGSVIVNIEDTVVLATVVYEKSIKSDQDFFPLTVDYIEKTYSAGKIPGSFFRREGRPSENETLMSRLIDRSIRPLFPDEFYNEVQVVIHVLSINPEVTPDISAIIAVSSAISISEIPFKGPIGASKVGYINNQYILNPTREEMKLSSLNMIVSGTNNAVLMVESDSDQLSEEIILGAIAFSHKNISLIITEINDFIKDTGKPKLNWKPEEKNYELINKISEFAKEKLKKAYKIHEKILRFSEIEKIYEETVKFIEENLNSDAILIKPIINKILFKLESNIVRSQILNGEERIDGRDTRTVRPIDIKTGILPRAHGSALFTRGETQALVVATLGTRGDEQIIDALEGEYRERFMLHYNMPSFATGEIGRVGSPKRREIGHGFLAKRALMRCLPNQDKFSYSIRVVSEITESNGSSSMASVCGGSLALMDAGVPIKSHIAGIAMGLIIEGNKFAVLTDILSDEDHLGDMDFKVAGTINGITALQMDIKITGITKEIIKIALIQAKEGITHILKKMQSSASINKKLSEFAPRMIKIKINPEKIRDIIGKGGSIIRSLTEETGTTIDISDDGNITISSTNQDNINEARKRIEDIVMEIKIGKIYEGIISKIFDFGAIVNISKGKDGLLHISEIAKEHVKNIHSYLREGQKIKVKVIQADDRGRIRLSAKALIK